LTTSRDRVVAAPPRTFLPRLHQVAEKSSLDARISLVAQPWVIHILLPIVVLLPFAKPCYLPSHLGHQLPCRRALGDPAHRCDHGAVDIDQTMLVISKLAWITVMARKVTTRR
jgi:hypothetical protein